MLRRFFTVSSNDSIAALPMFRDAATNTNWAKHRIDQLDVFFDHYVKTEVSIRVKPIDSDLGNSSQHFVAKAELFPFPIAVVVGEIIRGLRGSLDYAVSAMVAQQGGTLLNVENTYFPITSEPDKLLGLYRSRVEKQGLTRLRSFFLDEINASKTGNFSLWALNEIDRMNKHRALPIVITSIVSLLPRLPGAYGNAIRIEPGCEIEIPLPAVFDFENNDSLDRTLGVCFGDMIVFGGERVVPVLMHLLNATSETLRKLQKAYIDAYGVPVSD